MPRAMGYFPYGEPDFRSEFPQDKLAMPLMCYGGISLQRNPIILGEHSHHGFEIHLIRRGAMPQITANGQELSGRGGEVTLVQPGVLHRGQNNIIPKSELLWLVLDPSAPQAKRHTPFSAKELQKFSKRLRACGNCCRSANEQTFALYDALCAALKAHDAAPDASAPIWDLRWSLVGFVSNVLQLCESVQSNDNPTNPATVMALDAMAANLHTALTVESLAAKVGLSASRFYAVFKHDTGLTPADYHLRMRIAVARQALANDRQQAILAVAEAYGFANARHFSTVFKRFTGTTPSHWREQG